MVHGPHTMAGNSLEYDVGLASVKDQRGGHSRHISSQPRRNSACKAGF